MPPIKGLYTRRPSDGQAGVFIDTSFQGLGGLRRADFPAPGNNETPAAYSARLSAALTALFEVRRPITDFPPDDPHLVAPEPFCRVENGQYICQPFLVTVSVSRMQPLQIDTIEVGSGATAP